MKEDVPKELLLQPALATVFANVEKYIFHFCLAIRFQITDQHDV